MKKFRGFDLADVRKVIDQLKGEFRFSITNQKVLQQFSALTPQIPTKELLREVRAMIEAERAGVLQDLCSRLSRKFDYAPKPRDVIVALEADGYTFSRKYHTVLMEMLLDRNKERWSAAVASESKVRITLGEGEKEMWRALQRTYNLNSNSLASMLLRFFVGMTGIGKISPLDVPYLASSFTDEDLKRRAKSYNFTITKSRKSRF
jgi:hypothetical protein